jgi:hypothetical protein
MERKDEERDPRSSKDLQRGGAGAKLKSRGQFVIQQVAMGLIWGLKS